jgi:hypothetical protein
MWLIKASDIAGSRTPRRELVGRRLRRYAWSPQTVETDHPHNVQGAHIAGYALPDFGESLQAGSRRRPSFCRSHFSLCKVRQPVDNVTS